MNYQFTTEIDKTDYFRINDYFGTRVGLVDVYKVKSRIEWEAEPEIKVWGISSFRPIVKNVFSEIEWEVYLDELEDGDKEKFTESNSLFEMRSWIDKEKITGILKLKVDAFTKDWTIKEDFGSTQSGNLSPDFCEIDFRKKLITIS